MFAAFCLVNTDSAYTLRRLRGVFIYSPLGQIQTGFNL